MKNNLISVVLPVYNGKYLAQAIESVLNQTYNNFEFIIVNDGSPDNSLEIIHHYAKLDKRIMVIDCENRGLIASLNEGINRASGKYIARMDHDDVSLSNRFKEQVALMESKDLDICGGHYFVIDEDNNINGLNLTPISHEMCFLSLASKVPFAHPSVMIRKSFLDNNNLKYGQAKYQKAEDFDMWMRMYEKGAKFGNVNEIILKYRILEESLSRITNVELAKDTKNMLNIFYKNNKTELMKVIQNLPEKLNDEEKSLLVRFVFKLVFKTFSMSSLKYLKRIPKKIIICSILSGIYNG